MATSYTNQAIGGENHTNWVLGHIVGWTKRKTWVAFYSKNCGPISIMSCLCEKGYHVPGSLCIYMHVFHVLEWGSGRTRLCCTSSCLEVCIPQSLTTPICMHCLCKAYSRSVHAYTLYLSYLSFRFHLRGSCWGLGCPSTLYPASLHVTNSSRPSLFIVAYGKWSKIKLFLHSRVLVHVRATKTYFYYYSLCFSMFQHRLPTLTYMIGCQK